MSSDPASYDRIRNLWAPWRTEYIQSLRNDDDTCFLCRCRDESHQDEANLVLWRGRRCLAVLNRYPYTGGHALVAPLEHVGHMADLDAETMLEMMEMLRDLRDALAEAVGANGFNVGINLGRCAGAGLPGHLHAHIVPRWPGDTNFISVFDDARVIPASLEALYHAIREASERLGLPRLSGGESE
jgi:ATP adenylyltransferase